MGWGLFHAMYDVTVKLSQIVKSMPDEALALKLIQAMTEGLAGVDVVLLDRYPRLPSLYASGVRYRVDKKETWKDLGVVFTDKFGDCKDLVAWRLAELWRQGVEAKAEAIVERYPNRLQFHVFIRYATGAVEDPARRLGMP